MALSFQESLFIFFGIEGTNWRRQQLPTDPLPPHLHMTVDLLKYCTNSSPKTMHIAVSKAIITCIRFNYSLNINFTNSYG
jgi:hypothetical protein